jgi:hypothetical protein
MRELAMRGLEWVFARGWKEGADGEKRLGLVAGFMAVEMGDPSVAEGDVA